MPIECDLHPRSFTRAQYHHLDYRVMAVAFDIHRRLGRLHDERIYQRELAHRLNACGINARLEIPIHVSFASFEKTVFMDLVVDDTIIYELKAVESIHNQHRNQTLNYLFLAGLKYGKLVNLGRHRLNPNM